MRVLLSTILCALIAFSSLVSARTITPETTHVIKLSNRDINRIVCSEGSINDVFYSQEKGVIVQIKESNAFVKFLVRKKNGHDFYINKETEIHLVCNGEVYTIVAKPAQIQTQTIYMSGGVRTRIKENISKFSGMPKEEQLLHLTQAVYRDEIPDSYQVSIETTPIAVDPENEAMKPLFSMINIERKKEVRVEGLGYRTSEYLIKAKGSVELLEADFMQKEFGKNIAAITVTPLKIGKTETARLIIVDEVNN